MWFPVDTPAPDRNASPVTMMFDPELFDDEYPWVLPSNGRDLDFAMGQSFDPDAKASEEASKTEAHLDTAEAVNVTKTPVTKGPGISVAGFPAEISGPRISGRYVWIEPSKTWDQPSRHYDLGPLSQLDLLFPHEAISSSAFETERWRSRTPESAAPYRRSSPRHGGGVRWLMRYRGDGRRLSALRGGRCVFAGSEHAARVAGRSALPLVRDRSRQPSHQSCHMASGRRLLQVRRQTAPRGRNVGARSTGQTREGLPLGPGVPNHRWVSRRRARSPSRKPPQPRTGRWGPRAREGIRRSR